MPGNSAARGNSRRWDTAPERWHAVWQQLNQNLLALSGKLELAGAPERAGLMPGNSAARGDSRRWDTAPERRHTVWRHSWLMGELAGCTSLKKSYPGCPSCKQYASQRWQLSLTLVEAAAC